MNAACVIMRTPPLPAPPPADQVMGFMDLSAACSPELSIQPKPSPSGDGNHCGCSAGSASRAARGDCGGGGGGDLPGQGNASVSVGDPGVFVSKHVSALQTLEGFLGALTNASR